MDLFPTLLSPIQVGAHRLRNRVVMGSMHTRLDTLDDPIGRQAAFYAARAEGGVALIITGGYAPNEAGLMEPGAPLMTNQAEAERHKPILDAVHDAGAKILVQILHAGRYAKHPNLVAPSPIRAPINKLTPREMTTADIAQTIQDYADCAAFAVAAGFDGVEVMGSEGYLINQFAATRTNHRDDGWGGTTTKRHRFALEVVRAIRTRLGATPLLMVRLSAVDLVEGGATGDEIDELARGVEAAGADILNTGIGWHEAQVPTIAYKVPRAAWRYAAARLKHVVKIPVIASNRISTPEIAEDILRSGDADMVSMARPMLADPDFVRKAATGRADEINVCIACNQACLDFIFSNRVATCLVNPRACRETEFQNHPTKKPATVAVVGAGAAGLACAISAAQRGHHVTLFESGPNIGGQINLARAVPGKQEFDELLRYFQRAIEVNKIDLRLNTHATPETLHGFDHIVIATGVTPRIPDLPGIDHPKVATYADILAGRVTAGHRVVIMGAGGIGHDIAETLTDSQNAFATEWGLDTTLATAGGVTAIPQPPPTREVTIVQRSTERPGARLGISTGWILRNQLRRRGVSFITGIQYLEITDAGLHIIHDNTERILPADTIVLCTGQEPVTANTLATAHRIGGALVANELDAMRAIDEGTRLALTF